MNSPNRATNSRAKFSTGGSVASCARPTPTRCRNTCIRRRSASTPPMHSRRRPPGRLSSNEPNLQNIPVRTEDGRKIRRAFVATPGHKLVSADYSQIELRLLSEVADVPALRKAFQDGIDIHAMTASEMFGVPVEGMPRRHPPPRQGDQFRHHLRHLGVRPRQSARHPARGGRRLHQELLRALPRHPRLYGRDRATSAGRTAMSRRCSAASATTRTSRPSNPSIRAFNERAAINARLQGTAADIIRRAMVRMEDALAEKKLVGADAAAGARRTDLRSARGRSRRDAAGGPARDAGRAVPGSAARTCRCRSMRERRTIGTRRISLDSV